MVVVPKFLFYIFLFCTAFVGVILLAGLVIGVVQAVQDLREKNKRDKTACLVELSLNAKEKEMLEGILISSMEDMMEWNRKDRFPDIYDEEQRKALYENMDFIFKLLRHMEEGKEVLNDEQK